MNKAEYMEFHSQCCKKMIEITRVKNHDYTGSGDDPFSNFSNVASCGGTSPEQGFLVQMNDKMARISSFVQKGLLLVKDESVEDTLLDLANYCLLMRGFLQSKKDAYIKEAIQHENGLDEETKNASGGK